MKTLTFIKSYIRDRRRIIIAAVAWILIFFCLFVLEHVTVRAVWYPTLLCMVLVLGYSVYDYVCFMRKHRQRMIAEKHIEVTTIDLPAPENLMEKDYQELLQVMLTAKNEEINDIRSARKETEEYVTMWTHQIKTPLTALQLTAGDCQEPERSEMLARIFEIEQYADMMLQFLRLESAVSDLVLKRYSVKSMVNQTVKYFARIFISKNISVHVDIPDELTVVTDEKWMVFVLKQLVSNALKYTEQGSVSIYAEQIVRLQNMPEQPGQPQQDIWAEQCIKPDGDNNFKKYVRLIIEDTGIGIADDDLPRIFERGYTGYNGRKDKKATGLGLYLTERIVNMLNHEIHITSKVGQGTRVQLDIPE